MDSSLGKLTQRHVAEAFALNGKDKHVAGYRVRSDQMQNRSFHTELVLAGRLLVESTVDV